MAQIPADGSREPGSLEYIFSNTKCGYELEHSESGVRYRSATVHGSSSCSNDVALDCAHLYSSSGGYSSPIHDLESPSLSGFWPLHPAHQSSIALPTDLNTQFPSYQDGMSGISSWSPSDTAKPLPFSEAIASGPAGHCWKSRNTPPPEQCFDFGREPQNEVRTEFNGTTEGDKESCATPLVDLAKSSFTNDMRGVNCSGCHINDRLANSFSHTVEDRFTHCQSTINADTCEEVSVDHTSGILRECHQGHRVSTQATKDPVNPRSSSPKDPWPATSSISSSIPDSTLGPVAESWTCSGCGRVLATKGTKNRNRNKKRHHCPGTGPKCSCNICDKVYNRDDTLLLHRRKQHPEANVKPPQPRKRRTV